MTQITPALAMDWLGVVASLVSTGAVAVSSIRTALQSAGRSEAEIDAALLALGAVIERRKADAQAAADGR